MKDSFRLYLKCLICSKIGNHTVLSVFASFNSSYAYHVSLVPSPQHQVHKNTCCFSSKQLTPCFSDGLKYSANHLCLLLMSETKSPAFNTLVSNSSSILCSLHKVLSLEDWVLLALRGLRGRPLIGSWLQSFQLSFSSCRCHQLNITSSNSLDTSVEYWIWTEHSYYCLMIF
jgi:hypothetical protein